MNEPKQFLGELATVWRFAKPAAPRGSSETDDFALGCECAYPALQIELWCQDMAAAAAEVSSRTL